MEALSVIVWICRFNDGDHARERAFQTKARAIAYVRQVAGDRRRRMNVYRRAPGAYTYIGPSTVVARNSLFRMVVQIDRLSLPANRFFQISWAERHDNYFRNQLADFRPRGKSR
jgi:hypothetical protein